MPMTKVAIGRRSGKAFDIVRAHEKGFIVLRDDGKEYLLPREACSAVMHKRTFRAEVLSEAGVTYQGIDPVEGGYVGFNPDTDTVGGKLFFKTAQPPSAPEDPKYTDAVRKEAVAHLNKYNSDFREGDYEIRPGNKWSDANIANVQYLQDKGLFEVDVAWPNAVNSGIILNYATGSKKRMEEFFNFLASNGFVRHTASATNVAEAFVEGKASETAGDMKLLHGVVYSYAIPIGARYKDKFYVNLTKYSKTTSVHQNALIDVLERGNHPYKEVSEDQMLEAAAEAFVENVKKYTFQKEEGDDYGDEEASGSKAASASKSSKSSGSKESDKSSEDSASEGLDELKAIIGSEEKDAPKKKTSKKEAKVV